jgi:hydroxypyruvate isomerase
MMESISDINQIFNAILDTHFSGFIGSEYFPLQDPKKRLVDLVKK